MQPEWVPARANANPLRILVRGRARTTAGPRDLRARQVGVISEPVIAYAFQTIARGLSGSRWGMSGLVVPVLALRAIPHNSAEAS